MTRIIRTESPARTREKILQSLASAIHCYTQEETSKAQQKDICAFALLSLRALSASIDQTAKAWENRDYWIKADRLRSEWDWISKSYNELLHALQSNDIISALKFLQSISGNFDAMPLPKRKSNQDLWKGAWKKWKELH